VHAVVVVAGVVGERWDAGADDCKGGKTLEHREQGRQNLCEWPGESR
jgi:hypothetical protein